MIQAALAEIKEEKQEVDEANEYNAFYLALSSELNSNKNTWIIDSGASRHITGFKDKFENLSECTIEEVTIGDNSTHPIKGIGTCSIQLNSRITLQLENVLYVPRIKRNLVSILGLSDQGYQITFQEDKVLSWPKKGNIKKFVPIGIRDGILYRLFNLQNFYLCHETSKTIEIWHRRLGHIYF